MEYVTPAENNQHQHTIAPVDIYTAYGILREHYLEGKTPKDIKEEYGLSYSKVNAILTGKAYRASYSMFMVLNGKQIRAKKLRKN